MRLSPIVPKVLSGAAALALLTAQAISAAAPAPTLSSAAAPAPAAPAAPAALRSMSAALQELPLRFTGDGMTLIVTKLDEAEGKVSGTLQIPGGSPLRFDLDLTVKSDGLQSGRGRVHQGKSSRRIRTKENEDGSVRVTYRAKRYVVSLAPSGDAPVQEAGPKDGPKNTADTIRLKRHEFKDPKFRNQPSHTMLVPEGWKIEGGAFYLPNQFFQVMPSQEIKLTSPDGVKLTIGASLMAVDKTPPSHLGMQRAPEFSSDNGVLVLHVPENVAGWKKKFEESLFQAAHPKARNVRLLKVAVVPELTRAFSRRMEPVRQMHAQNAALEAQMGGRTKFECFVLGVESRFTLDGVEYEEISLTAMTVLTIDNPMMGREVRLDVLNDIAMRAPVGKLAASIELLSTLSNSLTETPAWSQMRAATLAKVLKISAQVAANRITETDKRSAIMSKAFDDVRASSHSSYLNSSRSSDELQGRVLRSINESEIYAEPGTNLGVQLPSGYDHVYSNGMGDYVLTNGASVNPASDLGPGNWSALEKARN